MKFYNLNEQGVWSYKKGIDFTVDPETDDVFYLATGALGVLKGKSIKFYTESQQGAWTYNPDIDLNF